MRACKICHTCETEDSFLEKMAFKLETRGSAELCQVTGRKGAERSQREMGLVLANVSECLWGGATVGQAALAEASLPFPGP